MKNAILFVTSLAWFTMNIARVQAALYWDGNGTAEGAGTTPNGIWGVDAFWNATADGTTTSPGAWVSSEDSVFSAGTDAAGPFTITIDGTQTTGNLTVEEGALTITGGTALNVGGSVAGKGIIDIASGLITTINTPLTGGDETGQLTKGGDGILILNTPCTHPGATTIAGGWLTLGTSNLLNPSSDLFFSDPTCVLNMSGFSLTINGLYGSGAIYNGGTLTIGQGNDAAANFSGYLYDGDWPMPPMTLIKVGTGKQTLGNTSFYSGLTIVEAGILEITDGDALGSYFSPTIVSNGATLQAAWGTTSEPVILYGTGFTNSGALRNVGGTRWIGGATLGSDARINNDGNGQWMWSGNSRIIGTNGESDFNLTIGGNGETIRLNVSYPSINIGTGTITKDGRSKLILDQPNYCSAFYFNGGTIYPRAEAQYGGFGSGKIYVGGNPCVLTADFMDITLSYPIEVTAGAKLGFNCNLNIGLNVSYNFTCNGVISGAGDVYKTNWGTLYLNQANTYSGHTTVQFETMALGPSGSISNSTVIEVQSGATFDVSAVPGGFVLGSGQTLAGGGTIAGDVTANGTLAPGAAANFGTLTFNNDLKLGEGVKVLIKLDREGLPSNDTIAVAGLLCTNAGVGTMVVTNVGGALEVGDSFSVISQPLQNGQALSVVGGGVVWTNKLWVDGTIGVVSNIPAPVMPVPRLTSLTVGGPVSVQVTWTNAVIGSNYWLQYSTNLSTSDWTDLSPVTAWGPTASQTDGALAGARQRYYRVRALAPSGSPPPAAPRITSVASLSATTVTLSYTNTVAGANYVVQFLTDVNATNWESLSPVKASGSTCATTDCIPAGSTRRFYRVYGQF